MGVYYAALFVLVLLLWPCALWRNDSPGLSVLWFAANTAGVGLVWYQLTSEETGFFGGLGVIGEKMRVGIAPVSMMVLAALFPLVFALGAVHALLGLALGRSYAQRRWTGLVTYFANLM